MQIRNSIIWSGLVVILVLAGCTKETTKNVSKIFTVPTLTLKGNALVILPVGGAYTDAGAEYVGEDGAKITIQSTSSNVNTATPGLYFVNFDKPSTSGAFQSEETRLVAVTSVNDPVDYSGTYLRAATGVNCYVQKVANGVYKVTNPGGAAAGVNVVVYYVETAVGTFVCPSQPTSVGPFGVNEIAFTPTGASWKVVNSGYGTGTRTFDKQ